MVGTARFLRLLATLTLRVVETCASLPGQFGQRDDACENLHLASSNRLLPLCSQALWMAALLTSYLLKKAITFLRLSLPLLVHGLQPGLGVGGSRAWRAKLCAKPPRSGFRDIEFSDNVGVGV